MPLTTPDPDASNGGEPSDATRALVALRRMVRALRAAGRDAERKHAVTAAQLFVLRELGATPGMSLGELAQRVHTSQSTVSEVVTRLVDAGFVRRRTPAADGRRRELSLSARGRAVVQGAPKSMSERLLDAFDEMPAGRRQAVADGLEAWLAAAGLSDAPAPMFFERRTTRQR
jgi:DNA-binding MarR family transcriptional regulator